MRQDDQAATISFLADPLTYRSGLTKVDVVETHISRIFFAGDRAFKLKRAVRLPYVDFSAVAQRLADCEKELELNRRSAPALYCAVRRITREADGKLAFDGKGEVIDAVVEMARFDEATLFDRLAEAGLLTPPLLTDLARIIAEFHAHAAVNHERSGSAAIAAVLDTNERAFAITNIFDRTALQRLHASFREALRHHSALLDRREREGKIRRCHGDLHLANICLVEGRPTLFDCLEFDDGLATIDILYDLAFVLTDLWHRGLKAEANLVFNRYLDVSDEIGGLALLPFFMALRAAIRAHVTATRAVSASGENDVGLRTEAKSYFDLALALLRPVPTRLVAIGGLSGSGKSTLAAALADRLGPAPGARVLASDRIRKTLFGVPHETRLPQEAYEFEVSVRVYGRIFNEARTALRNDHSAIADAVFNRSGDRQDIARAAADCGIRFAGFWLEAPSSALIERVEARRGDASDATTNVVRAQLAVDPGPIEWVRISSAGGALEVAAQIARSLERDA